MYRAPFLPVFLFLAAVIAFISPPVKTDDTDDPDNSGLWQWVDQEHPMKQPMLLPGKDQGICLHQDPLSGKPLPGLLITNSSSQSCYYSDGQQTHKANNFWGLGNSWLLQLIPLYEPLYGDREKPWGLSDQLKDICIIHDQDSDGWFIGSKHHEHKGCLYDSEIHPNYMVLYNPLVNSLYHSLTTVALIPLAFIAAIAVTVSIVCMCILADHIAGAPANKRAKAIHEFVKNIGWIH